MSSQVDYKQLLDAYGSAVRAGLLSPSLEVEQALRQLLELPPVSEEVVDNWDNEPVRRPVTLSNVNATTINEEDAVEEGGDDEAEEAPAPPQPDEDEAPALPEGEAEEADEVEQELAAAGAVQLQTYQPPVGAKNNAQKVLNWREKHGSEVKGMTEVGWRRARQLASGKPISAETVKKMAQFNRHRKNAKVAPEYKRTPWKDAGYVAWLGWGGTTGINWAMRISEGL